ncbi:acyl-CoA thioesterase [Vanrija albida]|uniref:Acyl-CoA thioesterase n=1 Tax=Vanrija albida TaxID=181172 RepID=A0ABR3QFC8_9TREE
MAPLVSITDTLAVNPVDAVNGFDAFKSLRLWTPAGARGVFGGQVIAQAMQAASRTVTDKQLHSQHCYFMLPLVHAQQDGKTVFILMASYSSPPKPLPKLPPTEADSAQIKEADAKDDPTITGPVKFDGLDKGQSSAAPGTSKSVRFDVPHPGNSALPKDVADDALAARPAPRPFAEHYQIPFPKDVKPWADATVEEDMWANFLRAAEFRGLQLGSRARAVQNYINERRQSPIQIAIARQQAGEWGTSRAIWLKPLLGRDEVLDENTIKALFGFMTDFQFIGTAAVTVGLSGMSKPRLGMMASLDHSMHYNPLPPNFDITRPLLHVMEAASVDVPSGRGLVRGLLYTDDGYLLATTAQEGVVRASFGKDQRPTTEARRNKTAAKL